MESSALKVREDWKEKRGVVADYVDVLKPFSDAMFSELVKNIEKGSRDDWKNCRSEMMVDEISYHTIKLRKAIREGNDEKILEHAADVANNSLMVADIEGVLDQNE